MEFWSTIERNFTKRHDIIIPATVEVITNLDNE